MKRIESLYRTAVLLLLLMLAAACTNDDDFAAPDAPATAAVPLAITVTDGAYVSAADTAPDGAPVTRATENGFTTEFTKGDRIGLYVAEVTPGNNGSPDQFNKMLHENLCLTYDGTAWKLPVDIELKYNPSEGYDIRYFAYYPYQTDMTGKEPGGSSANVSVATAPEFFHLLINNWKPQYNQSTYAAYAASDLMVAQGVVSTRTDGIVGSMLSFAMQHQMLLNIVRLPHTTCNYEETIQNKKFDKSYYLYTGGTLVPNFWMENPHTARLITNPQDNAQQIMGCFYCDSSSKKHDFSIDVPIGTSLCGKYKTYTVDKAKETESYRGAPREGDFYMKDGTILPQEAFNNGTTIPPGVKEDCIGVVFWVGEKKSSSGISYHWTYKSSSGDRLLMHEHPECIHGLVVALTDAVADRQPWSSTGTGSLYTWLKSYEATGKKAEKDLMLNSSSYYGYNQSRRLQWYRDYGEQSTEAYNAIETFAKANPTPTGCSGWYFPGDDETTVMAFGTISNNPTDNMTALLNTQFGKAGGSEFKTDAHYWNSTDMGASTDTAYCIEFKNNTRETRLKTNEYYVRAVLAF